MSKAEPSPPEGERLQKVLARAGVGSRRSCEELIEAGEVRVNGEVARLGRRVRPSFDLISVSGVPISTRPGLVYYLLNKPAGVVSSVSDPQGRRVVTDLVPASPQVHPVGRLDYATEGLLILTNDGDLTYRLTHPSYGVEKEYLAVLEGSPRPVDLRRLRQGVHLSDGPTAPARAAFIAPNALRIVIHEGRNRQVRRMCESVGYPVRRLVRTRIGPIADRRLSPGEWRLLRAEEVRSLEEAAAGRVRVRASTRQNMSRYR